MLAACAPVVAPRGLAEQTPALETRYFVTRDGLRLPLREWDAERPKAVIVALHGMSDYSEAFDLPGPYWAAHGITTFAYDQRGFGAAPDPGLWGGSRAMRRDLSDFVDAVQVRYPGLPVYALGESMGGAVVLSALAGKDPPRVTGAILCAPAVWSRADMPVSYRLALWLSAHVTPWLHVSGEGLHIWPSDNIAMLRKLSRDPLYQHSARADQVYGLVNLMDAARAAPKHLADPPPILFLYGAHDQVIPAKPYKEVIAALGNNAEVHRYPNGYHMLLRDLDAKTVWGDIVAWIDKTDRALRPA
ncbi:MAG: alpha/beta hydrolase [Alphaproteobacteria bacterium]|nr:alpha/beta hydrolase [Alphaproteobacteria bacterium]MDE2011911.1 lysophospholipase [Alphaproteobacteria bacterium]